MSVWICTHADSSSACRIVSSWFKGSGYKHEMVHQCRISLTGECEKHGLFPSPENELAEWHVGLSSCSTPTDTPAIKKPNLGSIAQVRNCEHAVLLQKRLSPMRQELAVRHIIIRQAQNFPFHST